MCVFKLLANPEVSINSMSGFKEWEKQHKTAGIEIVAFDNDGPCISFNMESRGKDGVSMYFDGQDVEALRDVCDLALKHFKIG